ncbi:LPS translocon maturation chaperone LptM [Microbulbifer sp. SA54]|uniref:LPS translocon maturation chaperone LptM n=1 Tax=Microbulbifer sp. SA54 TaxID=3401577 RepID=UPI003AAA6EB4
MNAPKRTLLIPLVLLLSACGQKGPLYLPQDPAQPASPAPAAATTPAGTSAAETSENEKTEAEKDNSQQHTEAEAVAK